MKAIGIIKEKLKDEKRVIITPEQVKEFGDKLNDNIYAGINFMDVDEAIEFGSCPECIKENIISIPEINKAQLEKITKTNLNSHHVKLF